MTPAEQTLTLLETCQQDMHHLDELRRQAGAVTRHTLALTGPIGYGIQNIIKLVTRSHHELAGDVERYRQRRRAIRQDSRKTSQQKRREIDALEKATVRNLGAKVRAARNKKRLARGRGAKAVTRRDVRTAKRSLYGTAFGTRGI